MYNTELRRAVNAKLGGDVKKEIICKARVKAHGFHRISYGNVKCTELDHSISSEILTAVNTEITVFRNVTS